MTPQKASSHTQQNSTHLVDLLRVFVDKHHLSLEELAGLLRISPLTLEEWFHEGVAPPAACLALAVLFDAGKLKQGRKRREQWPTPPHQGGRQNDYMLRMVRAI
jgi:hypothetical protein